MDVTLTTEKFEQLKQAEAAMIEMRAKEKTEAERREFTERVSAVVAQTLAALGIAQQKKAEVTFSLDPKDHEGKSVISPMEFFNRVKQHDPSLHQELALAAKVKTGMSTTNAQGGYACPTAWNAAIEGGIFNAATLPSKVSRIGQNTQKLEMPLWLTGLTVAWSTQLTDKSGTKPTLSNLEHILRFCYAIVEQSREFELFNNVDMAALLLEQYGQALGLELESQMLVGAGAPFTGAIATTLTHAQAGPNLAYEDLCAVVNDTTMLEQYRARAEWYMNRTDIAKVMGLKDGSNRPLFLLVNADGKLNMQLMGYPLFASTKMTAASALFLDPKVISWSSFTGGPDTFVDYFTAGTGPAYNLILANASAYRFEKLVSIGVLDLKGCVSLTGIA